MNGTAHAVAGPETYYLFRNFDAAQASNGYVAVVALPCQTFDPQTGHRSGQRAWGKCRLVFTNVSDMMTEMERYFSCTPRELDAMADRCYKHDMADDEGG